MLALRARASLLSLTARGSAAVSPSIRCLSSARVWRESGHKEGELPPAFETLDQLQRQSCESFADLNVFAANLYYSSLRHRLGYRKNGAAYHWITYRDLARRVDHYEGLLRSIGVLAGDRIGLICGNRPAWAAASFASARLGASIVPMYETQRPDDWRYVLETSGADVVFASNKADELCLRWADEGLLRHVFRVDHPKDLSNLAALDWAAYRDTPTPKRDRIKVDPDATVTIIFTSGTTGLPKGVELTHRNIASNVHALSKVAKGRYGSRHVHFSFLPWAHIYGQTVELYMAIYNGAAMGLAASPKTLLDDIVEVRPTVLVAVPTLFQRIHSGVLEKVAGGNNVAQRTFKWAMDVAEERREALDTGVKSPALKVQWELAQSLVFNQIKKRFGGRLEYAMTGGASLHKDIQTFFGDIGIPVLEGYGLTETSPVIASERWGPTEKLQGGLRAIEGVTIFICDPTTGAVLPPGTEGEIVASGPNVMKGYYNNPQATDEVIVTVNGMRAFRTGDKGRLDENGILSITGRIKEQYKLANGKFVVPGNMENALMASRYVEQAFIYGRDKPHNIALLVPNFAALAAEIEGASADPKTLLQHHGEKVRLLLEKATLEANNSPDVRHYEAVKHFAILDEPFSTDNGLLTPKLSMKRPAIEKRYMQLLQDLYT